jgi:SpoIID/LytB domain protein
MIETYPRPTSGVLTLSGRGFGHGIGMSQWGAYGAATKALTWPQILGFYYPGTSRAGQGDPTLRVWLSAVGTSAVPFSKVSGLVVSDGTRTLSLSGSYRWRIVPEGSAVTLQANSGAGWFATTGWRALTRPLTVSRPSVAAVRVLLPSGSQREYSGSVRVVNVSGRAYAVNLVGFERYTRAVVPVEMSASWPAAALSAQAVAVRTYAANSRASAGSRAYDVCDVACQAYRGVADYTASGTLIRRYEDTRSTNATAATAGTILTYGGKPAFTQYSSSNGGRMVKGSQPYLPVKDDPYDGAVASSANPHSWTTSVAASAIERAYPSIGRFVRIGIGPRVGGGGNGTWGGRVSTVTITGSLGTKSVSGDALRSSLGLRSTWWVVTSTPPWSTNFVPRDVTGDALADVVIPSGSALQTLSYNGSLGFTTKQIAGSGFYGMRASALIGPWGPDNLGDVAAIGSDGTAWVYPGLGTSGLSAGRYVLATGWSGVSHIIPVGDLDEDGFTDIVTRWTDGRLVLHRGNGSGRIVSSTTISTGWSGLSQITSADADGDGHPDLLAVRSSDGALLMYRGSGTGGLMSPVVIGVSGWTAMSAVRGVGDVTGDGRDDLLTRRKSDGALFVYRLQGAGRVTDPLRAGTYASTAAWGQ